MKERIKTEIEQHQKFQESVLGKISKDKIKVKEIDIRNYAKYILRERSIWEKRELLSNLRSKLMLKEKKITVG
jgi:hypothetical protein